MKPPHLVDEDEEERKREALEKYGSKIGLQGLSKYGPGGRRVFKAKGRKKA